MPGLPGTVRVSDIWQSVLSNRNILTFCNKPRLGSQPCKTYKTLWLARQAVIVRPGQTGLVLIGKMTGGAGGEGGR